MIIGSNPNFEIDEKLNIDYPINCYMHESRFNSFLEEGVQFTRSDFFAKDDPFEAEFIDKIYELHNYELLNPETGKKYNGIDSLKKQVDIIRKKCFASCWTSGFNENIFFWKIYGKQKNAVAVCTNLYKLQNNIENAIKNLPSEFKMKIELCKKRIVKIQYISYNQINSHTDNDTYAEMLHGQHSKILHYKNISYSNEEEVRIIFDTYQTPIEFDLDCNLKIPIEFRPFIQKILVSPYACNCYFETVKNNMKKYGLENKVEWSSLKYTPGRQLNTPEKIRIK